MPELTLQDPITGRTKKFTLNGPPPSPSDMNAIFEKAFPESAAKMRSSRSPVAPPNASPSRRADAQINAEMQSGADFMHPANQGSEVYNDVYSDAPKRTVFNPGTGYRNTGVSRPLTSKSFITHQDASDYTETALLNAPKIAAAFAGGPLLGGAAEALLGGEALAGVAGSEGLALFGPRVASLFGGGIGSTVAHLAGGVGAGIGAGVGIDKAVESDPAGREYMARLPALRAKNPYTFALAENAPLLAIGNPLAELEGANPLISSAERRALRPATGEGVADYGDGLFRGSRVSPSVEEATKKGNLLSRAFKTFDALPEAAKNRTLGFATGGLLDVGQRALLGQQQDPASTFQNALTMGLAPGGGGEFDALMHDAGKAAVRGLGERFKLKPRTILPQEGEQIASPPLSSPVEERAVPQRQGQITPADGIAFSRLNPHSFEGVRQALVDTYHYTPEQAHESARYLESAARHLADANNTPVEDWYRANFKAITRGGEPIAHELADEFNRANPNNPVSDLPRGAQESVTNAAKRNDLLTPGWAGTPETNAVDSRKIVYALSNPDASTGVHEFNRVIFDNILKTAKPEEVLALRKWAGLKGREPWSDTHLDRATDAMDLSLAKGQAPHPSLETTFQKFKGWIKNIYGLVTRGSIAKQLGTTPFNKRSLEIVQSRFGDVSDIPSFGEETNAKSTTVGTGNAGQGEGRTPLPATNPRIVPISVETRGANGERSPDGSTIGNGVPANRGAIESQPVEAAKPLAQGRVEPVPPQLHPSRESGMIQPDAAQVAQRKGGKATVEEWSAKHQELDDAYVAASQAREATKRFESISQRSYLGSDPTPEQIKEFNRAKRLAVKNRDAESKAYSDLNAHNNTKPEAPHETPQATESAAKGQSGGTADKTWLDVPDKVELSKAGAAIEAYRAYKPEIDNRIVNHPDFAELQKKVEASERRSDTKERAAERIAELRDNPYKYLQHIEYDAKSSLSKRVDELQRSIMKSAGIPRNMERNTFRNQTISWSSIRDDGLPAARAEDYPGVAPSSPSVEEEGVKTLSHEHFIGDETRPVKEAADAVLRASDLPDDHPIRPTVEDAIGRGRQRLNTAREEAPRAKLLSYDPSTGDALLRSADEVDGGKKPELVAQRQKAYIDAHPEYFREVGNDSKYPVYRVNVKTGESNDPDTRTYLNGKKGDAGFYGQPLKADGINVKLKAGGVDLKVISKHTEMARILAHSLGHETPDRPGGILFQRANPRLSSTEEGGSFRDRQEQTPAFKNWFGDWQNDPANASKVVDENGKPLVMYHGTPTPGHSQFMLGRDSMLGLFGDGYYFTNSPEIASEYSENRQSPQGDRPGLYPVYLDIKKPFDMEAVYARKEASRLVKSAVNGANRPSYRGEQASKKGIQSVLDEVLPLALADKTKLRGEDVWNAIREVGSRFAAGTYEKKATGNNFASSGVKSLGYDGIAHEGGGRYNKHDPRTHQVYIAFESNQIKSATGNNGEFSPSNSDIRFQRANPNKQGTPVAPPSPVGEIKQNLGGQEAKPSSSTGEEAKPQSSYDRVAGIISEVTNAGRSVLTSLDFSAPLRQGNFFTFTEPKISARATGEMIAAAGSEKVYDALVERLAKHPDAQLAKDNGLFLTTQGHDLNSKEEAYLSNLATKIPGVGASERAYKIFLDNQRMDVYSKYASELKAMGFTPEKNSAQFKRTAELVNILTGRGPLPKAWNAETAKQVAGTLFAPRFMSAKFHTLIEPFRLPFEPPGVRKIFARQFGAYVGMITTTLGLLKAIGATVSTNPDDPDFLKAKFGNFRYDITGGNVGYVRYALQMLHALGNSARGVESERGHSAVDLTTRFLRGKLAPASSLALDFASGKDFKGDKFSLLPQKDKEGHLQPGAALERVIPLIFQDIADGYQEAGLIGSLKMLPSGVGISTSAYGPNKGRGRGRGSSGLRSGLSSGLSRSSFRSGL